MKQNRVFNSEKGKATMEESRTITLTLEELAILDVILINHIGKCTSLILTTDNRCIPKSFFERLDIASNLRDKLRDTI